MVRGEAHLVWAPDENGWVLEGVERAEIVEP